MGDIKEGMDETEVNIKDLNSLTDSLVEVKEETARYSQLGTAQENLNKLINVPEIVKDTENAIFEDRLLEAHKALSEVEQSRDELLFELHRLQQKQHSSVDKDLLNEYFIDASKLSVKLEKKLNSILGTTLNTVRQNPKVIVTALRIIEREEKLDAEHQSRLKSTGFLPPGRPKCWRSKCMEKLKQHVLDTIEGLQLEDDREQNKMWLVRYLELIRIQTQKDLRIAKTLCVPVFPPSYKILEMYIDLYHEAISQRLIGIVSNGLEDQEDVTVLQWIIKTYPGEDMLTAWNLRIDPALIKPLLDETTLERLKQEYLDKKESDFKEWMKRALELETEDWKKDKNEPEKDENGKYQTSFARTVFQMVDQNLQVAETISEELTHKLFMRSLEQFICVTQDYCGAIKTLKGYFFLDRNRMPFGQFTRFMVAIVNNSELSQELSQVHRTKWLKPGQQDNDSAVKLEKLLDCYNHMKETASNILLDEVFLDIEKDFEMITTPDWENKNGAINTVSTLEDYFRDYSHLRENNFETVTVLAQERVAIAYMNSLLQPGKKIMFENSEQRAKFGKKIARESEQLQDFFRRVAGDTADFDSPFKAIGGPMGCLAEVISQSEVDMLILDVGSLVKKYPDISKDQLTSLLNRRGDLKPDEVQEMIEDSIPKEPKSALQAKSIFSKFKVEVSTSKNPFSENKSSLNLFEKASEMGANLNPFGNDKNPFAESTSTPNLFEKASEMGASLNPFGND